MSYLKDREIWLSNVPTGNPPTGYFWKFIQNGKVVVRDSSGNNQIMVATSGSQAITGSLTVTGGITGTVSSASYVEYSNVANKPALVSGSSQITYSGLTGIPSGIVSGSAQITSFGIFATTGSNGFNGNQSITGSLTVTGQVVAQTLNVQQVTSSIVYSSGSNIFGNSLANTQQFTGSVGITGSLTVTTNGVELQVTNTGVNLGNALTDSHIISGSLRVNPSGLFVSGSGNVGINTTIPSERLSVVGAGLFGSHGAGSYSLAISNNDQSNVRLRITNAGSGGQAFSIVGGNPGASNAGLAIYDETNAATRLYISSTGAATFSGSVTATGGTEIPNGQFYRARRSSSNLLIDLLGIESGTDNTRLLITGDFNIKNGSLATLLNMTTAGTTTFLGPTVTIGTAVAATNVKLILNGVASKAAGIEFHQSGTPQWYIGNGIASEDNNFELYNSNGTMAMKIIKSTNAINFIGAATFSSRVGVGGAAATYPLTAYNASNGTTAAFGGTARGIRIDNDGTFSSGRSTIFGVDSSFYGSYQPLAIGGSELYFSISGTDRLTISSTGAATFSSSVMANGLATSANYKLGTTGAAFISGANNKGVFITDNASYASIVGLNSAISAYNPIELRASGTDYQLYLSTNGNVGIGTPTPSTFLHVFGSNTSARGQLSIQSNNASNAARATWYYDTTLQGNIGTTSGDFYIEAINNLQLIAGGNISMGSTSVTSFSTPNGGQLIAIPNAVIVSGLIALGSPYTQNIQIDIVYNNWGGNNVLGLVDMIITLREYAHTSGTAFGKIFATNSSGGATFASFNTTNITTSQCSVTATSGGNYTLRITIDPSNVTDRGSYYLTIPNAGGTGSTISSITVSYV